VQHANNQLDENQCDDQKQQQNDATMNNTRWVYAAFLLTALAPTFSHGMDGDHAQAPREVSACESARDALTSHNFYDLVWLHGLFGGYSSGSFYSVCWGSRAYRDRPYVDRAGYYWLYYAFLAQRI